MTEVLLAGESLHLLPEKAAFWPSQSTLFISDLHLGKVMHFRKAGIAVPRNAGLHNFEKLDELLISCRPDRVVFLGDLFHSEHNVSWNVFCDFRSQHKPISFELVVGNHDILDAAAYAAAGLKIHQNGLAMRPFYLSHHPEEHDELFNLCGHLHPGVRLKGRARQSLRLSCFWVRANQMVLPAFGTFTGLYLVSPVSQETLYAIANREILKIEQ